MPETRDRLLAAAVQLMRSRGFRGTGLKDVTVAAGATTGSLYHFFPGGKGELVRAAVRVDGAAHEAVLVALARETGAPGPALTAFFDSAADVLEQTGFVDLCPIGTVAGEVASTDDEIRAACDDVFAGWQRVVVAELTRAGLDPGTTDELAALAVAALLGGFVLARTRRSGEPLRAAGRQVRVLVDARVAGAAGPGAGD